MKAPVRASRIAVACWFALVAVALSSMPVSPRLLPLAHADARGDADARGELDRARGHFQTGQALFKAGRYRDALAEFARADAIVESPINSYNIALCHDRLHEAQAALRAYRAYLDAMPEAPNRREVAARISALQGEVEAPVDRSREPANARPDDSAGGLKDDEPPDTDTDEATATEPPGDREEHVLDPAQFRSGESRAKTSSDHPDRRDPDRPGDRPIPRGDHAPRAEAEERGAKPVYKSWWFWGVAGVSALILLNIATASSDGSASLELFDPPSPGGATIWRF